MKNRRIAYPKQMRHDDPQGLIEGNKTPIKSTVIEDIQRDAIPWISTPTGIGTPWDDMAGVNQLGNVNP